jgi:hypothetical protein
VGVALALAVVAVAVALLVGGGRDDPPPTPSPGVGALERDQQAAIEAVLGFARTTLDANNPPNPSHPGFATYSTDRAQATAVAASEGLLKRGLATRLPPNSRARHGPEVVSIDGNTAVVRDCAVDDSLLVDIATGRVVEGEGQAETVLYTVVLVRTGQDAPWKVSFTKAEQRWYGITGCAA